LPRHTTSEQAELCASVLAIDVDDLKEGRGADDVDRSDVFLAFLSAGYCQSKNCIRELLRAVVTNKPVVALLESDPKHGCLTLEQLSDGLRQAVRKMAEWHLDAELAQWGFAEPTAAHLVERLHATALLEWTRIPAFQVGTAVSPLPCACPSRVANDTCASPTSHRFFFCRM
jgi:hypothetical protein